MTAAVLAIIGVWLTVAVVFTGWLCQAARSSAPATDEWAWLDDAVLWEHEQAMWDAANQPVFAVDKVSAT